jgi:hypothetical protein
VTLTFEAGGTAISFGALTLNRKKGTATQIVNAPAPGVVALSGEGVKAQSVTAGAKGPVPVLIKATGNKKQQLKRKGKVKVTPTFTFTPTGGTASTKTLTVKLKR